MYGIAPIEPNRKECEFINAYFQALYFTDTGDIDQAPSHAELDQEFERESVIDCLAFYQSIACYLSDDQIEQAGHDFWLTRQGHGAGFWDGGWPKYGDMFDKRARAFGEVYPVFENYLPE